MELPVSTSILVSVLARPLALRMLFYTLVTSLISHRYWTMTGPARRENMFHFNKNLGIMGGFLLLRLTGPGRYFIDTMFGLEHS
ncbi:MAG: hypothetical protein ACLPKB_00605 [Xanthobacteraceae bacterium]